MLAALTGEKGTLVVIVLAQLPFVFFDITLVGILRALWAYMKSSRDGVSR